MADGVLQQSRRGEEDSCGLAEEYYDPDLKRKGNPADCANYWPIRLQSHSMKVFERVIDRRVRHIIRVSKNQCGFVANCIPTDAIHAC
ncbi:hypothetical protein Y032_0270g844 [Ancylostoma ceylanicum]|uniref:Reverse transcriptase domain-containing protein n=1 Tax=Ancylostoma ceylanicum TaxID=53326 RepID=A0A016S8H6_9BILA|nr:hypothetical protein Y032_0270g844 [Ancylostoma ceylanicum]